MADRGLRPDGQPEELSARIRKAGLERRPRPRGLQGETRAETVFGDTKPVHGTPKPRKNRTEYADVLQGHRPEARAT